MGKITKVDLSRIMSTQAKKSDGQIQKDSFAARIQSAFDKEASNQQKNKEAENKPR